MKTIETADRLDRSLDIIVKREIENIQKEFTERRKVEQQKAQPNKGRTETPTTAKVK